MFSFKRKSEDGAERRRVERGMGPRSEVRMVVHSLRTRDRIAMKLLELTAAGARFRGQTLEGLVMRGESVDVQLTCGEAPVIVSGEVVWVNNHGREFEGGIRFDDVSGPAHDRLQQVIARF